MNEPSSSRDFDSLIDTPYLGFAGIRSAAAAQHRRRAIPYMVVVHTEGLVGWLRILLDGWEIACRMLMEVGMQGCHSIALVGDGRV